MIPLRERYISPSRYTASLSITAVRTFIPQALDHAGMDIIERLDPQGFTAYLKQFGNTICGRHPIGVFLNMVAEIRPSLTNGHTMDLKFLKYAQSSQVSPLRMR